RHQRRCRPTIFLLIKKSQSSPKTGQNRQPAGSRPTLRRSSLLRYRFRRLGRIAWCHPVELDGLINVRSDFSIQANAGLAAMPYVVSLVALVLSTSVQEPAKSGSLQTVGERSGYRATARYDDVASWCAAFAKATPLAHLTELGQSSEGRSIPLLIVADP